MPSTFRLQDAELTVLTIDPAASPATAGTSADGFAFTSFRIAN